MNNTTIIGNIGKPPELRYTPSKMAVAEFSVATTRGKDDKKQTTWHTITAFGKTAENAAASLQKGNRVIVIGRIDVTTSEKDGQKRTYTKIVADNIGLDLTYDAAYVDKSADTMKQVGQKFGQDLFEDEEAF